MREKFPTIGCLVLSQQFTYWHLQGNVSLPMALKKKDFLL